MGKIIKNGKKVLIVEDDPILARMYGERVAKEGYEVLWSKDGINGVNTALIHGPDLIVLDLLMPHRGGLGMLRVLRTLPLTKDIPVIILTGYPEDNYLEAANRYGVAYFLNKATTLPRELIIAIKESIAAKTVKTSAIQRAK
jgi:twitching motility two-component system response regulator PilH